MSVPNVYGAVSAYLLADAGVASVVSDRVFAVEGDPLTDQTQIVYSIISAVGQFETGDDPDGIIEARFQFDCYGSSSFASAHGVFVQLDAAMRAFRGTQPNGTVIHGVRRESYSDLSGLEGQRKVYRVVADYIVMYRED